MNQTEIQMFLRKYIFSNLNIFRNFFSSPILLKMIIKYNLLKLSITASIFNKKESF